jgi:hypothetical protein
MQTELAASHRALALQASPFHASAQSAFDAQAGALTQPFSTVQYCPVGHAVAASLGPMLCLQAPATQVSIVQENSSSQSVEQDAEPLPPTAFVVVPPAPAAAESDGGVDSLVQAPEERMDDAMATKPIDVCCRDAMRR